MPGPASEAPTVKANQLSTASLLMAGLLIVAFAPACAAQGYYGYQRDHYRGPEQRAYDNGYNEGLREGQRDARSGRNFSYERPDDYRDADDGYRRSDGDKEFYRRVFRQGFQAGYSAGFNSVARDRGYGHAIPRPSAPYGYGYGYGYQDPYPQWGPSGGYPSPAAQ